MKKFIKKLTIFFLTLSCSQNNSSVEQSLSFTVSKEESIFSDFKLKCEHTYCPESLVVIEADKKQCSGVAISNDRVIFAKNCFEKDYDCKDLKILYQKDGAFFESKCESILTSDHKNKHQVIVKPVNKMLHFETEKSENKEFNSNVFEFIFESDKSARVIQQNCDTFASHSIGLSQKYLITQSCDFSKSESHNTHLFLGEKYLASKYRFISTNESNEIELDLGLGLFIDFECALTKDNCGLTYSDTIRSKESESILLKSEKLVNQYIRDEHLFWSFNNGVLVPKCIKDFKSTLDFIKEETFILSQYLYGLELSYVMNFDKFKLVNYVSDNLKVDTMLERVSPFTNQIHDVKLTINESEESQTMTYSGSHKEEILLKQCDY